MSDIPKTMSGWVQYGALGAALTAEQMSTADLFREHAECVRMLCTPVMGDLRERWEDALDAVCEELGKRVDGAYSRGMR